MNQQIIDRLIRWKKGEKAGPEKVQIYPTNLCNLNCVFCAQQNQDYGYENELSDKKWIDVIKEIIDLGTNRILISGGGEPFSRPGLTLKIMKIVKENNLKGRLITNGTLLNKKIIKEIVDIGWNSIVFSIDAPDAKTHDRLRGSKGCFKKAIDNLNNLNQLRRKEETDIEINFVINKLNFKKIPEMILFSLKNELDSINFEPLTINNPKDEELKLNKGERKQLAKKIVPQALKLLQGKQNNLSHNLNQLKNIKMEKAGEMKNEIVKKERENKEFEDSPCFEPWLWPKIEANGDVWPCSTAPLKENVKEKDFADIWFGKEFDRFREKIKSGEMTEHCDNCVTTHIEFNKKIRNELRSQ